MHTGDLLLTTTHSGAIGSISWQSVPALLDAPAPLLAKQWKKIFDQGKVVAPPMAAISSAIFGYLAYRGMFAHVSKKYHSIDCFQNPLRLLASSSTPSQPL